MRRVGSLAADQVESDDIARCVRLGVFVVKPPRERLSACASCPFAPAADTCARTMVESNIWIRCADELMEASVSKKASNTLTLLKRSKRFHTLFQCPNRSGGAPPSNVFDRKEMKRFEEPAIVFGLASATRKAGPKHRERMRPVFLVHPCPTDLQS
ncbi:hypothetical protein [Methylocystis sp. S23]